MGYESIGMAGSLEIITKPHVSFKAVISWSSKKEEPSCSDEATTSSSSFCVVAGVTTTTSVTKTKFHRC